MDTRMTRRRGLKTRILMTMCNSTYEVGCNLFIYCYPNVNDLQNINTS